MKELRKGRGLTFAGLAEGIKELAESRGMEGDELRGTTASMMQQIESGRRQLVLRLAILLADYYDVTIDYLIGRSDDGRSPAYIASLGKQSDEWMSDEDFENHLEMYGDFRAEVDRRFFYLQTEIENLKKSVHGNADENPST